MKKVTIIIPVYNAEKTINKCLSSIINQTYKNLEILVINDGSKDNSLNVIKNIDDDRIKVIDKKNEGVAITRNLGIKIASGDYIMFIDNDDYIDENYVQTHVENMDDYDVVISGYRRPNEKNKIAKTLKLQDTEWSKLMVLAPWAKIYRKDYLLKNNIEFLNNNIGEDVYFNLQALLLSNKVKIIDYIGYNWFFNSQSVSNTIQKDFRKIEVLKLLDKCYEILEQKNIIKNNYELIEMHFIRYIIWFLSYTSKKRKYHEISIEYDTLFNWLKTKFPNYKYNKMIGLNKPIGEVKNIQKLYFIFMTCHKIKLGKLLVYIYSKI